MADMYELADERVQHGGPALVRAVELGARPGMSAGTTSPTGAATTGGGSGPGAHSHVAGTRWWNVKHPAAYVAAAAVRVSPAAGREVLDAGTRAVEDLMLRVRMADGCPWPPCLRIGSA